MKSLKKTSFIEAVAAAIEHEVQCFNFYLKLSESLPEGQIRELFSQLALDGDEHIKFIKEIYKSAEGKELPNLKQLSEIEKFHSSTIQKVMDRLDRNKNEEVKADERKALELAIREGEDARNFYATIRNKFQDPKINLLFQKLANFNESNNSLLEAQAMAMEQSTPADQVFYWEDEDLMEEVNRSAKASSKPKVSKPQSAKTKPSAKKTVRAVGPKSKKSVKPSAKKAVKKTVKKAAKKSKPAKKKGKKK
ncbi:ferritin family protein [Leptospira sp. 2 VSF19]|uniref:Ferritin family protein n=1 Tax=Leptospira soteropolitanensis TaxID=2950025 RepID=A0AAW5VJG3_9LEPT|nr:ferritin family protein [Leptospira soteropolitanensis]MCW7492425.1 ferritin family protein [Leptospira soteropolitanensis]MCW7500476.1 ferritin family protein [Leptospira soteropolitanensis]MCW7522854.1 ferritin family protein [Leptospira soteropolitanensis]MCW7526713.1 ferritin family protein [Leptospira soteropolitanensis]MCW7530446.1 ferritin family protein [Leptospira soteropolitanensis]